MMMGRLRLLSTGRWSIALPGRTPVEITSGEVFLVEVDGELKLTRMEHLWGEGYYSIETTTRCATVCAQASSISASTTRRNLGP
jgi:hypothetical protein